eukprot:scaffold105322_cov37-Attheya_sp.AAC.1
MSASPIFFFCWHSCLDSNRASEYFKWDIFIFPTIDQETKLSVGIKWIIAQWMTKIPNLVGVPYTQDEYTCYAIQTAGV